MTKQLYEEALADVKKLKEVAEDNAKRAILEAVTPRIRDLIENQLLGETVSLEKDIDTDNLLTDDMPEVSSEVDAAEFEDIPVIAMHDAGNYDDEDSFTSSVSLPDAEGKVTLDLDMLQNPEDCDTGEMELSYETAQALGALLVSKNASNGNIQNEVNKIVKTTNSLRRARSFIKESKGFSSAVASTLAEVKKLTKLVSSRLIGSNRRVFESTLQNCEKTLINLMEHDTMRRNRRLSEADVTMKLTGLPDDVNLDDVGIDLITGDDEGGEEEGGEDMDMGADDEEGGEEGGDEDLDLGGDEEGGEEGGDEEGGDEDLDLGGDEEGGEEEEEKTEEGIAQYGESRRLSNNVIVEIDENMLRREISRMRTLREEAETKAQSWGNGPGDVSDDFEDDDLGDPFVDVDLTTESDGMNNEMDPNEMDANEMDPNEMDGMKPESQQESRIRRAIVRERHIQLEAKKNAKKAKAKKQVAEKQARTQNKKVQQAAKKKANQMKEAYAYYARRHNASVIRENRLMGMLSEARSRNASLVNESARRSAAATSNLRNKLAETNLFNAKLLFTNKLLQNESLTKRQKAEIIERLDEARSEREVKLMYEAAVKTITRATGRLSESATQKPVIGSASRATRPAATLNESYEVDRWARLAGIK